MAEFWCLVSKINVMYTYSHHVITLHIWLILILALVVELSKEIEGHHSVEIDHNCQQAHCQHQLRGNTGSSL